MNIKVEMPNVNEVKCALSQPKEASKEEDLNTISPKESKMASNKEPISLAIRCASNSFVNRSIGMHLFEVLGYKIRKSVDLIPKSTHVGHEWFSFRLLKVLNQARPSAFH